MCPDYLTGLNKEQRRAAEHCESATKAPPLLVIAGAGSGKTKTLAHRVAHLVVTGVDPNRILLLTFTRRAAEEMIRRVKRITAQALSVQQLDLPWSGTFHAIGAAASSGFPIPVATSMSNAKLISVVPGTTGFA